MLFKSIISTIRRRRSINKIVHELSKLSDRELDDIGVARKQILSIAKTNAHA
ncbi:MAG: hypothetical protein COB59_08140 [Rhodospirillaceae bacterium]|nr:MAG: hypothetical protein COB59_08140 [Rhodospirillaceae bacterium]